MKHLVYNAGPFFNPEQEQAMMRLETLEDGLGLAHFDPRKGPESRTAAEHGMTASLAEGIFLRNMRELERCTVIAALLDWRLEPDHVACLLAPGEEARLLNVPDTGTVFELGYAFRLGKPVVGFREDKEKPLNVMLSRACWAVCHDWEHLTAIMETLAGWKGRDL